MKRLLTAVLLFSACAGPKPREAAKEADPAVAALQGRIARDSTSWQLHVKLADELRRKKRLHEAGAAAEKAFLLAPAPQIDARLAMAKVYAAQDRSAAAINLVKEVEKKKLAGEAADEVKIAEVYAVLGDRSAVFRWLERAQKAGSPNITTLNANPDFEPYHDDLRWASIAGS